MHPDGYGPGMVTYLTPQPHSGLAADSHVVAEDM